MESTLGKLFLGYSAGELNQLCGRIESCLDKLSYEQVWSRGTENENAVGNLVLHLCGNVRQWIGTGVGGREDIRRRDEEFAARAGLQPAELRQRLRDTVGEAVAVIQALPVDRLTVKITIQAYTLTLLEAIYHVVEHFGEHTGQILFATKELTGEDLGFYRHLNRPAAHGEKIP